MPLLRAAAGTHGIGYNTRMPIGGIDGVPEDEVALLAFSAVSTLHLTSVSSAIDQ
jgi:hypothetical protein